MEPIDLSPFCKTKSQARDFAIRLAAISDMVYQTDFHLDAALSAKFGIQNKDALLKLIRESGIAVEKASDLKTFITKVQTALASLPVLSLSLAFEPTEATLKLLTDWFLKNSKRHVLFDIQVDPSLIAGVAIRYNGKYIEYSIKPTVYKIIQTALTPQPTSPPLPSPTPQVTPKHPEQFSLGR